ncbi:MAG: DUF1003 domain-containing protein [Microbacterium sp.]|uniref:DUF1003 domain-containing protein n=1 Tax=Microbacterium sp. TaxID=51671 RepID=UPI002607D157|nr:DUF1003 domain-containing protein [Microbacterium sp.]MCX6502449.1 DUF1003 domain-containing protein [Microbacterium sp.]
MARISRQPALDAPLNRAGRIGRAAPQPSRDRFGRATEWIARAMGTPWFLIALTVFCLAWIAWNTMAPQHLRFDAAANGFTALTLMLSLQASYAAPLILLAQNRQDDRERVQIAQDRQRAERNLADTEYLAREIVALRLAMTDLSGEVVTREGLRDELRALVEDLDARASGESADEAAEREERRRKVERRERAERDARER